MREKEKWNEDKRNGIYIEWRIGRRKKSSVEGMGGKEG